MSDTTFVWKCFFVRLIPTTHPAVYQYIMGGVRSKESAVMRITEEVFRWCSPYWMGNETFTITFIRGIARQYLKSLEDEWKRGNVKLKEIY